MGETLGLGPYTIEFDEEDNERDLICIEKDGNEWIIESNESCEIFSGTEKLDKTKLQLNKFYVLKIKMGFPILEIPFIHLNIIKLLLLS